jgi:parallel beta-helix repeat protein
MRLDEKMKKRFLGTILTIIILSIMPPFRIQLSRSSPATITVPDDYPTIQSAVDASGSGDTIFVKAGTYYEHVVVGKSVSLVGEIAKRTIIDGADGSGAIVRIIADGVNVTGLTIRNSQVPYEGIRLDNSSRCRVFANDLLNNWYGIYLRNSSRNDIVENNMTNNVDAIHLEFFSNNNSVARNSIKAASFFGVHLISSSNNSIVANNVSDHLYGIYLRDSSSSNEIIQNNATKNRYGVYLDASSKNSITVNDIMSNSVSGIFLYSHSNNNTFYDNNFVDNALQVNSSGGQKNVWDNGSKGNFWSDYVSRYPNATEIDGTGVWKIPYVIDANNTDDYPLTNNVIIPEFTRITFLVAFISACCVMITILRRKHLLHAQEL